MTGTYGIGIIQIVHAHTLERIETSQSLFISSVKNALHNVHDGCSRHCLLGYQRRSSPFPSEVVEQRQQVLQRL